MSDTAHRTAVPLGWFSLGRRDALDVEPAPFWAAGFREGGAVRIRALGRELAAWRCDGRLVVADAHCPHEGAHLGVGGQVADGCLVCPLHGRRFRPDGSVVETTAAGGPGRLRLRTYPVEERDGLAWGWFHPDPLVPPRWSVDVALDGLTVVGEACCVASAPWHEVVAQQFELRPFRPVTGEQRQDDGVRRRWSAQRRFTSPDASYPATITSTTTGPGQRVTELQLMGTVVVVVAMTPLDADSTRIRTVVARSDDDVPRLVAADIAGAVERELARMASIWEHQRRPVLPTRPPDDRAAASYRRWAEQFVPAPH